MSSPGVVLKDGYSPYFSFDTGFGPQSNIASTRYYQSQLFDWRYEVVFKDGSGVVFGFPSDNATFTTNAKGHLILTGSQGIASTYVYAPGSIPGDDVALSIDDALASLGGWENWSGSIFAANFTRQWLSGDNFVFGTAGTGPDPSITDNQTLRGFAGSDFMGGGNGDDTFYGGKGADTLIGGGGSDTFIYEAGDYAAGEAINGSSGFSQNLAPGEVNTIEARADVNFSASANITNINRLVFNGANTMTFAQGPGEIGARPGGVPEVGIQANTLVVGDGLANTLNIRVASGYLDISGFTFSKWSAADSLVIKMIATSGITQVFAADTASTILGNSSRDWVTGGSASDDIRGAAADDILSGKGGADVLRGGDGLDQLTGGGGRDVFVYTAASESAAGANRDVITDFNLVADPLRPLAFIDRIDVSAIDASVTEAGSQAFQFIGTADFSGEGQIRAVQQGGDTVLQFNLSGNDQVPEMEMLLGNVTADLLSEADFIF